MAPRIPLSSIDFDKLEEQIARRPNGYEPIPSPEYASAIRAGHRARYEARKELAAGSALKGFQPSPQQADFFRWLREGRGSCILVAVAGAGKTTTLLEGLSLMQGDIFFGAYNKSIATELKLKAEERGILRRDIRISTMHAAGFGAWRRQHPKAQVEERKVAKLADDYFRDNDLPESLPMPAASAYILKMVSLGKNFLMNLAGMSAPSWDWIEKHFSVAEELPEGADMHWLADAVDHVYKRSLDTCPDVIDFDDMIFAPIAYGTRMFQNDWVLIDECQDINPARLELARRMLKRGGRLVAVGDPRQAIYGFTGADADAVQNIKKAFNAVEMPLTVTYRCPKSVVAYVHQWVSHIEAHPSAPEGICRAVKADLLEPCWGCHGQGSYAIANSTERLLCEKCHGRKTQPGRPWYEQDAPGRDDVILCRYTRPLMKAAYSFLKAGIACKVEGRDIGKGLIALATKWKVKSLDALDERLGAWMTREIAKARASKRESRIADIEDRVGALRVIMEGCRARKEFTVDAIVRAVERLFDDNVKGVLTLCTGHKSKGREWQRVYLIRCALRGARNLQPWEKVQEDNINYVMGTRSMGELIFIPEALIGV